MRFLYVFFALVVMAAVQPAQAMENRISVTDIHNFINNTNSALNNPNLHVARNFLNRTTAENAVFENTVSVYDNYAANPYDPYHRVWYNNPAYGYYYRYPLNQYYAPTSMHSLKKWDMINQIENKKRMIPGYQAKLDITDTVISPYGGTAVVDIDLKEYSTAYNPYMPGLTQSVLNANSKCKMYLSKKGDNDMLLTRMDCNTNTNLPF